MQANFNSFAPLPLIEPVDRAYTRLIDNFIVDKFACVAEVGEIKPSFVLRLKAFYGCCCSPPPPTHSWLEDCLERNKPSYLGATCSLLVVSWLTAAPPGGDNMHGTYCHSAWHAARANGSQGSGLRFLWLLRRQNSSSCHVTFLFGKRKFSGFFACFPASFLMPEISVQPEEGEVIAKAA